MMWLWMTVALAAETTLPDCASAPTMSADIAELYAGDQADRDAGKPFNKDDEKRLKALEKIDKKGGICALSDHVQAATIYLHSVDTMHHKRAYELGLIAAYQRDPLGTFLVTRGLDKMYVSQGKKQHYGTQFEIVKGKRCLIAVDESIPDSERAKWGLPGLTELYQSVLDEAGVKAKPTAKGLTIADLLCEPTAWKGRTPK